MIFKGFYDEAHRRVVVLRSTMGQYDSVYDLTVEQTVGRENQPVVHLPIEVGKIFDSEGVLRVNELHKIYDSVVRTGKGKEDEKSPEKKIKKK